LGGRTCGGLVPVGGGLLPAGGGLREPSGERAIGGLGSGRGESLDAGTLSVGVPVVSAGVRSLFRREDI
jgi:hypothetical protein